MSLTAKRLSLFCRLNPILKPSNSIVTRPYATTAHHSLQPRKKILTLQTNLSASNDSSIHPSFVRSNELKSYLNKPVKPCVSATTAENYDLAKVESILSNKQIKSTQIVQNETISFKIRNDTVIFIFKFGTVVAWNLSESKVLEDIIPMFNDAIINPYKTQTEDLDFIELNEHKDAESYISSQNEIICLNGSYEQQILDMLAYSYGVSRSTRLAILEQSIEDHIELTKSTIQKLSKGEAIGVDANEVLKLSGRLLLLRGKLNLYSELVETPDIYWSESRLEKIHDQVSTNLDVPKRINILNRKLDYLTDEAHALIGILTKRNETTLELIIIYLIMVEVGFELYHFYERLGGKYSMEYFKTLIGN